MDRKIFYIGIALLVAAVAVLLINGYLSTGLTSGLQNLLIVKNLTVRSYNFSTIAINSTNSSYLFIIATSKKPVNMYLFNSTGLFNWERYAIPLVVPCTHNSTTNTTNCTPPPGPTGLKRAIELEGTGVFAIFNNITNATVPQSLGGSTTPLYISNDSIYPQGTYYFVIDNTNSSASASSQFNATVLYLPPISNSTITSGQLSGLGNQITQAIELGVLFIVLVIAGAAVLIYGFLKKPADSEPPKPSGSAKLKSDMDKEQVDRLYKDIEKREKAKKTKK